MANGITAIQKDAAALKVPTSTQAVPCYLGQAPIWQVDREDWKDIAGTTIVAKSLAEVRAAIGHAVPESGAWPKEFSLSMVMNYHVAVEKILPVILIVNKASVTEKEETSDTLTFVKNQAKIASPYVVLSSVSIDGKVKGEDYEVAYDENGRNVYITGITELTSETVKYKEIDPDSISFSGDTYEEIDYIPQNTGMIAATLSAPLWDNETDSKGNTVMSKLAAVSEGVIDKHYYVECFGQLDAGSRSDAIAAKEPFTSAKMKICWPYAKIGSYIYPISLIFGARKQTVDGRNDGIPYESASNEQIPISCLCDKDGNLIKQLELEADSLNEVGIATMAFVTGMKWVTWGVCMANYAEANRGNIPPNKLNDVAVQMMDFICNDFEERYGDRVHKPMSIRAVNDIVNSYTLVLNGYISQGMLIAGTISFEPSENNTANIADGQFVYSITETNTPPAKAIIANVTYDSEALNGFFEGGESNE